MHLIQAEKETENRKHIASESRHFVSQTFRLRPIFGCKMGDTSSLNEAIPLEEVRNTTAEYQSGRVHSSRFVNITDLRSATRTEEIDEQDNDNESDGDLILSGYEAEDSEEPLLTDIKLTCSDCETEKGRSKEMEVKVQEMSDNIQRLERKIDSLVNALLIQGNISSDKLSLVDVRTEKTTQV